EQISIIDHPHGFLGGTNGLCNNKLFFIGNIDLHKHGLALRNFIENQEVEIMLAAEGDIKEWTVFYRKEDPREEIRNISVSANARIDLVAIFRVPEGTPNKEYRGIISVAQKPENVASENDSITSVIQKIDREVVLTVDDKEIVEFLASPIPKKYDLKEKEPLAIKVIYDNLGNTGINPQIHVKLMKDSDVAYNVIFPFPENIEPIKPLSRYEIPVIEIPTTALDDGKYSAKIEFLHNGKSYVEKNFTFSIGQEENAVPALSLRRIGRIKRILWPLYLFLNASAILLIGFLTEKKTKIIRKNFKKTYQACLAFFANFG
ncbi:MAG: DUF6873 family GME fold protein, partial [Patescibacteria group bacterium]